MTSAMAESNKQPSLGRDIVVVAVVAIIALMLGVNLFVLFDDSEQGVALFDSSPGAAIVGEQAPDFELPVFGEEKIVTLEKYRGRVVVLDFWATWCPPCRDQMPELQTVSTDPSLADDVVILSINTDRDETERDEKVAQFLDDVDVTLPTLMDTGAVQSAYQVGTIPTLVVIDPQGEVDTFSPGVHDADELHRLIERAL